jgi:hypothetical protein
MSKLAIVATTLPAVFGGGQPVFAEEVISEPGWVCGLSNGANVLKRGPPHLLRLGQRVCERTRFEDR